MKMKWAIACAAVVLMAGCASVGTKVNPNTVAAFKPGVTTIQQAEAKLGEPNNIVHNADGSTLLQYTYAHAKANGASYIPVVGLFAGKTITDSTTASLKFDKNGRYVSHTTSQGHTEGGLTGS